MKKNKTNQKILQVTIFAILVVLLVGVVGYFLVRGSNTNSIQQPQSENSSTSDVGAMISKVRMEMPKTEVNTVIGEPYECTQGEPAMAEDVQRDMEQCSYGDKNAADHLNVTYMNGKVWGTTSVSNTTR